MNEINITEKNYTIEINPTESYVLELNEQGPQGLRGYTGNGIESYVKTSSSGLTDTYTITFTDGNTTTVDVTNGKGIVSIEKTSTLGLVDTYTITYNDSTTSTFTVTNGADGNGVINTEYISSSGLVDTYHINYTNGNYDTFTVTNGQNGSGSVADVLVNGTSVLDGQDAKILIKTINSNSITGSGNLDVGTVTSVNNIIPISGDVTLTASNVGALSDSTKYGADLSYSSNNLQLLDQDGNGLGSSVTIQSSPDIDNKSITTNLSDELQTVGVIDQNNTTNAIKTWTGTKAQYTAIVSKDSNTLYNITDDTDVTLPLLELLFPVGAVYFGTMSVCPLQVLGVGTWQALPPDKVIQIAGTRGSVGDTLNESLPNITGTAAGNSTATEWNYSDNMAAYFNGALYVVNKQNSGIVNTGSDATKYRLGFDASRSSSTYQDNAPVQQDAYLLNGWRRIA